jgi:peptidoglycan-associated lipoprotein
MLIKNVGLLLLSTVLIAGLAGCASKAPKTKPSGLGEVQSENTANVEEISRFRGEENWDGKTKDLMAKRVYRFGFDRFDVAKEDYTAIEAHADYLKAHPDAHVRLEGYTDEQGSREYNIALGERRAKAVREIMSSKGVPSTQYDIVSYGAEKPEMMGNDESAFSVNRRAVVAYEKN